MHVVGTEKVSKLRKGRAGKANLNIIAWRGTVDAPDHFVSAIPIMEWELGVLSTECKDVNQNPWTLQSLASNFIQKQLSEPVQSLH